MGHWTTPAWKAGAVAVVGAAILLDACATAEPTITPTGPRAGLACVDDSKQCIDQRAATLRSMMTDPAKNWVREPATAEAYASGVRLFAYKGRKRDLSCEELALGRREADAAPSVLRGPGAGGLSAAQVSRGTMLAGEVSKELGNEMKRRCRT